MSGSEAKNLEAISKAIDHHNATCEYPAVAVAMIGLTLRPEDLIASINYLMDLTVSGGEATLQAETQAPVSASQSEPSPQSASAPQRHWKLGLL